MPDVFDPRTDLPDGGKIMFGYQVPVRGVRGVVCRYCKRSFMAGDLIWRETPKKYVHQLVPEMPELRSCEVRYEVGTAIAIEMKKFSSQ